MQDIEDLDMETSAEKMLATSKSLEKAAMRMMNKGGAAEGGGTASKQVGAKDKEGNDGGAKRGQPSTSQASFLILHVHDA